MEYELLVASVIAVPFLAHWKVKGPVPEGVVLKLARLPGQSVRLVRALALVLVNTVKDARAQGFDVMLLVDAVRAVNVNPGDGEAAEAEMRQRGARPLRIEHVAP